MNINNYKVELNDNNQILFCQFHSWYKIFKNVTIKSQVIPLPHSFIEYLLEDYIILPNENQINQEKNNGSIFTQFPELIKAMYNAIADLGGKVFPKLNWSSPIDAVWITIDRTLCCQTPRDIILLLKSSSNISNDISLFGTSFDYYLILRKWSNLLPGREFRCWMYNRQLIGISQRDINTFYPFLVEEKDHFLEVIKQFFYSCIQNNYLSDNASFDVYVDSKFKVYLLDFGLYSCSNTLLFEPDDLEPVNFDKISNDVNSNNISCSFRILSSLSLINYPSSQLLSQGYPQEIKEMNFDDLSKCLEVLEKDHLKNETI